MLGASDGPDSASRAAGLLASENQQQSASPRELTALGNRQASALGDWLSQQVTLPTHLYSSPLRRVQETWEQVQQRCPRAAALEVVRDRRLTEINQGIFTGLTWPEAQKDYPQLCKTLELSVDWQPVPGAESPSDCRRRANALVSAWLNRHSNEDCLWVISHGGFLSHLVSELLGCDRTWGYAISPTALFELELDLSRWFHDQDNRFNAALWKINRFNSVEHLAEAISA